MDDGGGVIFFEHVVEVLESLHYACEREVGLTQRIRWVAVGAYFVDVRHL